MDGPHTAARPRTSIFELAGRLWHELPGLVTDRVELLKLELQRAGKSLVTMLVLGLAAAVLLLTAWFALWIGVAAALVALGLHWGWAWAIVMVLNLGAAAIALVRARALVSNLTMPATKRHLTLSTVLGSPARPHPAPAGHVPPAHAATPSTRVTPGPAPSGPTYPP